MSHISTFRTLEHAKIQDLIPEHRDPVTLQSNDSISQAFDKLAEKKIHGLFVMDGSTPLGWIDIYDLTVFLIQRLRDLAGGKVADVDWEDITRFDVFDQYTAIDVVNLSGVDEFVTVGMEDTLGDVVHCFFGKKHRLAVVDDNGEVVNIVSQMDLITYMIENNRRNGDFVSSLYVKMTDCPWLVTRNILSVHKDTVLAEALLLCFENLVTGTAIVDDQGKIIGNLSASDLIAISGRKISLLGLTVEEYFSQEGKTMRAPITVGEEDLLELVYVMISENRIHRVYVVDESNVPTGIVSLTDLIRHSVYERTPDPQ